MKSKFFISFLVIMVHILSVNCRQRQLITMPLEQGGGVVEKRVGSSPPSCEHKCYGCSPCEATQVPANGGHVNVSIQYSNYEPEGWKCKCGPSFYSP